jgi:hypothetical protein
MSTKQLRVLQLAGLSIVAFAATMTAKTPEANAVVYCTEGAYVAG